MKTGTAIAKAHVRVYTFNPEDLTILCKALSDLELHSSFTENRRIRERLRRAFKDDLSSGVHVEDMNQWEVKLHE